MGRGGKAMERMGAKEKQSNTQHSATRQAEWCASAATAVSSTTYGEAYARILTVAAEAGDTATEAGGTEVADDRGTRRCDKRRVRTEKGQDHARHEGFSSSGNNKANKMVHVNSSELGTGLLGKK